MIATTGMHIFRKWSRRSRPVACAATLCLIASCGSTTEETEETVLKTRTPVTITHVSFEPLAEYIELSATAQFVQKAYVKANVNGYVTAVDISLGNLVTQGQPLFTLRTKEAQSIGNAVNRLDPSFRFSGINVIRATNSGYVAQLDHQEGDYVQDGEQLAVLNDAGSFAFVLNLPYELRPYIINQKTVQLTLPDNTVLAGTVGRLIPTVDPASQTQQIMIQVPASAGIPENLIARVRLVKNQKSAAQSLPKSAVLSDEGQLSYWVMRMINDSTAVKVPVEKGMETKDAVEIVQPQFTPADRILLTGNYGLPDTAGVLLETKPEAGR